MIVWLMIKMWHYLERECPQDLDLWANTLLAHWSWSCRYSFFHCVSIYEASLFMFLLRYLCFALANDKYYRWHYICCWDEMYLPCGVYNHICYACYLVNALLLSSYRRDHLSWMLPLWYEASCLLIFLLPMIKTVAHSMSLGRSASTLSCVQPLWLCVLLGRCQIVWVRK